MGAEGRGEGVGGWGRTFSRQLPQNKYVKTTVAEVITNNETLAGVNTPAHTNNEGDKSLSRAKKNTREFTVAVGLPFFHCQNNIYRHQKPNIHLLSSAPLLSCLVSISLFPPVSFPPSPPPTPPFFLSNSSVRTPTAPPHLVHFKPAEGCRGDRSREVGQQAATEAPFSAPPPSQWSERATGVLLFSWRKEEVRVR